MCGPAQLKIPFSEIAETLNILGPALNTRPMWNLAPTMDMLIARRDHEAGARLAEHMYWGLVPRWSKEPKMGYPTFNAKAETVDTLASFRAPWREGKRCLVVTSGFYEWKKGRTNPKLKQPYAIARKSSPLTVMAGLWEVWRGPNGESLRSCTVITTEANALMAPLHSRMPVILAEADWPTWLGENPASPPDIKALLRPYPADDMQAWPVSQRVGNVRNNDPELLEAVEVDAAEFG
jgi:putative SOS response-associated peptidase YedK